MALAANALTTEASLRRHLNARVQETDYLRIYHTGSGVTSATVAVTSTALVLVTNLGTSTLLFTTYTTLSALMTAIAALGGWTAVREGDGALVPSDLRQFVALDALLVANERYLRGGDTLKLHDAINAASAEIERWTGRTFASTAYRHALDGQGDDQLILPHYPIISVAWVAVGRMNAIEVKYTSTTVQYATVEVTATAVVLNVAGTSVSVTIGSNTLTQLVALINAQSGWTASLADTTAGAWLASELMISPPVLTLNANTLLTVPEVREIPYRFSADPPILYRLDSTPLLDQGLYREGVFPVIRIGWPRGQKNIVVKYTAGYATIPDDLRDVCNVLAANLFRSGERDTGLLAETVSGASYSKDPGGSIPDDLRRRLAQYRNSNRPEFVSV